MVRPPTTRKLSDAHEDFLADLLGGRKTAGSGSTWNDPADGRNKRYDTPYAFAWDGKSTLGKSISISREMWAKIQDQAQAEIPMIALRFYEDDRLKRSTDLICIEANMFSEILDDARKWRMTTNNLKGTQ